MKILKPYSHIKNFLYRFTLIHIGNLHIRIHKLVDSDRSTLLHNHPFNYISVILKGGYNESVLCKDTNTLKEYSHDFLSIINRKQDIYHRINSLKGVTYTLFIAYGRYDWKAMNMDSNPSDDGLFQRTIKNKTVWSKKEKGIWFIGNADKSIAEVETRHSIHQI